jgi:hypothetical protein
MLLRHATFRRNLPSIRRFGLLCSKSRGKLRCRFSISARRPPKPRRSNTAASPAR